MDNFVVDNLLVGLHRFVDHILFVHTLGNFVVDRILAADNFDSIEDSDNKFIVAIDCIFQYTDAKEYLI